MSQLTKPAAFVVIPEFVVRPDCIDAFVSLAQDGATQSLGDEPGCRQFDVVQVEGAPQRVYSTRCTIVERRLKPIFERPISRFREGFPALALERPVLVASRHHE